MLTSVGARGSYLLEDVTVISTELVRLYRLLSSLTGLNLLTGLSRLNRLCRLCGLRGLRIVRRHCLGRFILTVVQAVLRGEYLSRRIGVAAEAARRSRPFARAAAIFLGTGTAESG